MKFMINCDEATAICDKSQYGEATIYDKIRPNFHLLVCKYCKSYTKKAKFLVSINFYCRISNKGGGGKSYLKFYPRTQLAFSFLKESPKLSSTAKQNIIPKIVVHHPPL